MSIVFLDNYFCMQSVLNELEMTPEEELLNKLVKEVALSSLKEFIVSGVITGIACHFVAVAAIPTLLIGTISILAINIFSRSLSAYMILIMHREGEDNPQLNFIYQLSQCICPMSFSALENTTTGVLVHEAGHALAAMTVYKDARASIEVFPFMGGVTRFYRGSLTAVGEQLGARVSRLCVTAAGPLAGILVASGEIGLAHYVQDDHPQLSLYLLSMGIMSIAQHVIYALSALWEKSPSPGHDFVQLWRLGGIHPIQAAICMVALPMLVKTMIFSIDYYRHS